ncbi:MAG: NADPH-dependent 7-cyano-7-deazaguanine reductase QueF [Pseudomarimonas sp.]
MHTVHDSALGKATIYAGHYDPGRLFPIARAGQRATLGTDIGHTFFGADIWNAYEFSWLDVRGRPRVALLRLDVPADSPNLIESKSLKLYLNGFMQQRVDDISDVEATLHRDLSAVAGAEVSVDVMAHTDSRSIVVVGMQGESIDDADVDIDHYGPPDAGLLHADAQHPVTETLTSDALKSNCPVTGQPDWATLHVTYSGPRIDRGGLLRYVASFREHADFHEHCVERMFVDLRERCAPTTLLVYARYTRRGGIDINPWRSSEPRVGPENKRTPRQ